MKITIEADDIREMEWMLKRLEPLISADGAKITADPESAKAADRAHGVVCGSIPVHRHISELRLPSEIESALRAHGVYTTDKLVQMTPKDFMAIGLRIEHFDHVAAKIIMPGAQRPVNDFTEQRLEDEKPLDEMHTRRAVNPWSKDGYVA